MCKLQYFCDAFSCMCTNVEQSNLYMLIPTRTYLQAIIGCQYIQHALVSLTFDSIHGFFCHKDKKTVFAAENGRIELFPISWGLKAAG